MAKKTWAMSRVRVCLAPPFSTVLVLFSSQTRLPEPARISDSASDKIRVQFMVHIYLVESTILKRHN
jgi:hypothetical protein